MGLRGRLRRLTREAEKDLVVLKLRDGSTRIFEDNYIFGEMFLTGYDLFRGKVRPSEVLDAVRQATPESRAAFEAEYGSIEMRARILAAPADGGWVDEHRLLEDGTVQSTHHEGGSEEAERIRQEIQQQGPPSSR
jgi:hypothetical protein